MTFCKYIYYGSRELVFPLIQTIEFYEVYNYTSL